MDSRLPLLTVETVLFPGLVLPIDIDDTQNRALLRDLVARNGGEMVCGALAIRDGYELGDRVFRSLHGIGCAAVVSGVDPAEDDDDGPMQVTLTGSHRFRVVELDGAGDYLIAKVDWLPENAGSDPLGAASIAVRRFRQYASVVSEISRPGLHLGSLPDDPTTLSYLIAAAMVLQTQDRQKLLEVLDTTTRLAHLVGLIDSELRAIAALPSLPAADLTWADLSPN